MSASPERAFAALLRLPEWWDPAHTYSGDASNLSLELAPGGCLCERWEGGAVEHLRLVYVEHGKELRFRGGLGPLQSIPVTGAMSFSFRADAAGSLLVFSYDVGGATRSGLRDWAAPVDAVWAGHLARYRRLVETGTAR